MLVLICFVARLSTVANISVTIMLHATPATLAKQPPYCVAIKPTVLVKFIKL